MGYWVTISGWLRLGVDSGQAGRLRGLLWRSHHPGPFPHLREPVEGPREGLGDESVGEIHVRTSPVEVPALGSRGGKTSGGAAPGPRTRETVYEVEATLVWRVAAEAEAGEARSPSSVREGKGGEEAMSQGKKSEPFKKTIKLTDWVTVKPRQLPNVKPRGEAISQKKPETERKEDDKERINEELEFLIEMEDRIPRKEEKKDYDLEQLVEECVDNAMAELRRALPPEELEIYEKCYRLSIGAIQQQ